MHEGTQVIARPAASDQLVLLFHGVGASAADLAPLGEVLARERPRATVVSVEAPHPSELGRGKEWFSVVGVTEEDRPRRVAAAMPLFMQAITHWQAETGLGADRTVLVGFSQGAIMSLESTQVDGASTPPSPLAHTVIAMAGRFAGPVRRAPKGVQVHLIHGSSDGVVPTRCSVEAEQQLRALGALGSEVTLDIVPELGHGIDGRALQHVLAYLPRV